MIYPLFTLLDVVVGSLLNPARLRLQLWQLLRSYRLFTLNVDLVVMAIHSRLVGVIVEPFVVGLFIYIYCSLLPLLPVVTLR